MILAPVLVPAGEAGPSISVFGGASKALRGAATGADSEEETEETEEEQQHRRQQRDARLRSGSEAGPSGSGGPRVYWQGLPAGCGAGAVDPGCPSATTGDALEAANVVRKHYRIKVRQQQGL